MANASRLSEQAASNGRLHSMHLLYEHWNLSSIKVFHNGLRKTTRGGALCLQATSVGDSYGKDQRRQLKQQLTCFLFVSSNY